MAEVIREHEIDLSGEGSQWEIAEIWAEARRQSIVATGRSASPDVQIVKSLWQHANGTPLPDAKPLDFSDESMKKVPLYKFFREDAPIWEANPSLPEASLDLRATWASMDV